MEVFRIAKCAYINDMSGKGAELYGGRWNSKGFPVVYTSGSRALAALEVLVHVPLKNATQDYCIADIFIPEQIKIKELTPGQLPSGWETFPYQPPVRLTGDEWCREGKFCILKVPSVIVRDEWNYLINPSHPDARKIIIKATAPFPFDKRLKKEYKM